MNQRLTETVVEEATLEWFAKPGFGVLHGPDIDPDSEAPARAGFADVVRRDRYWQPRPAPPPQTVPRKNKGPGHG
ncbi:MAG: hypothetical protein IIA40_06445 [SAR324 cluster bacterium]|nr:hypothetical protein [SAR324 cluster bacterium]